MLEKELEWLSLVTVPPPPCPEVQTLLAGHLNLIKALVSCSGNGSTCTCNEEIERIDFLLLLLSFPLIFTCISLSLPPSLSPSLPPSLPPSPLFPSPPSLSPSLSFSPSLSLSLSFSLSLPLSLPPYACVKGLMDRIRVEGLV